MGEIHFALHVQRSNAYLDRPVVYLLMVRIILSTTSLADGLRRCCYFSCKTKQSSSVKMKVHASRAEKNGFVCAVYLIQDGAGYHYHYYSLETVLSMPSKHRL